MTTAYIIRLLNAFAKTIIALARPYAAIRDALALLRWRRRLLRRLRERQ